MIEISRKYLEIKNLNELNQVNKPDEFCEIEVIKNPDFQINKFFYKQIGKKHRWIDRLSWTDQNWINYLNNKDVKTYIFKYKNELAGYFEQIYDKDKNEYEIAYFGILEEYRDKHFGGYLLSCAISVSLKKKVNRVWVHTCSLDHKNALKNYISRGMKIYKTETLNI